MSDGVGGLPTLQVALIVHPVVEHADDDDPGFAHLEEDAMATAGRHAEPSPQVVALATDDVSRTSPFIVSRSAAMYSEVRSGPHVRRE